VAVPSHAPARTDPELALLYEQLRPALVRFAEGIVGDRADAEEAVQDAFLAASRAGRLDDPRPWLYRVTRNAAVDVLRRRRRLVSLDADGDSPLAAVELSPHAQAELSDELRLLRQGIDRLPDQQRSSLLLRELAGLGYREIAGVLDVSEANVKVLIFRARRSLDDFAQAVRMSCESAQLALSARADSEAGRGEAARARLHASTCSQCRGFAGAIGRQRSTLALLVPALPVGHGIASAALGAASAKAGGSLGGLGSLFGLKAAAATVAAVAVVSTGAVVAEKEGIVLQHTHPPRIHVATTPFAPSQRDQHRTGEDSGGGGELRGRAAEGETEGGGGGGSGSDRGRGRDGSGDSGSSDGGGGSGPSGSGTSGSGKGTSGSGDSGSGGSGSDGSSGSGSGSGSGSDGRG